MSTTGVIFLIVAIVAVALCVVLIVQQAERRKLRAKFGTEYDRLVEESRGDTHRADAIIEDRERRTNELKVRPLTQQESDAFAAEWQNIQRRFVDEPKMAVWSADSLVGRALQTRGYPAGTFEERITHVSVEFPQMTESYRVAHDIAMRDQRGQATTEELRRSMQYYRDLMEHVLDTHVMRV